MVGQLPVGDGLLTHQAQPQAPAARVDEVLSLDLPVEPQHLTTNFNGPNEALGHNGLTMVALEGYQNTGTGSSRSTNMATKIMNK